MTLTAFSLVQDYALNGANWLGAGDGAVLTVHDPATGDQIGTIPAMGRAEACRAIEAADAALGSWRRCTAAERGRSLGRWAALLEQYRADLARLLTAEQGKPLAEAEAEIDLSAAYIRWFAEEARRAYGEIIPSPVAGRRFIVQYEPVGVCAAITPWNFPAAMIARKVAPALAAGCTMVVKPAEATPLSALALAALALEAGIPAGVLSVVTGDAKAIGAEFTQNPLVRKLSFTGSTTVGKQLMAQCSTTVKRVSLELGGNAPFIVFDDADIDAVITGAVLAKFRNAGQTCVCANRFYVHSAIYDRFARRLADAAAALIVGPGTVGGVDMGPLIDARAAARVRSLVMDALEDGASLLTGGLETSCSAPFFPPTVLGDVTHAMRIAQEEIFGPVASLIRFDTEEEAITLANASEAGLAAYVYSRNLYRAWRVADALQCGMVAVNAGHITSEVAPFGGVKQSGMGREGSRHGLTDYMEIKFIALSE